MKNQIFAMNCFENVLIIFGFKYLISKYYLNIGWKIDI